MEMSFIDLIVFVVFIAAVILISLWASRRETGSADYFLAGRSLTWPLIGVSLIVSNISTEQFVGMSGAAFGRVGMAIASYEWMSAICLVFVAWWLLPKFLKAGIYTMPEFLEYRYNAASRSIMAFFMMLAYVVVALATVLYSGAIALNAIFDTPSIFKGWFHLTEPQANFWALVASIWFIAIIGGAYTIYGGLKAVVWADLIQGITLLIGGAMVTYFGFKIIGSEQGVMHGFKVFMEANQSKLHTVLPWNDPDVPWLAVFVGGLWIPAIFYWGLNQFITQRTLAAKNLAEGQKGILLAGALKLTIPFICVFPGIIAYHLFRDKIANGDSAYPYLIKNILPPQFRGFLLAALCGAIMGAFNSMLNSAATIFTIDFYSRYINRSASQDKIVKTGRIATGVFVIVACLWAPVIYLLGQGVFNYIQKFWGFVTPGIVTVFIIGMTVKKAPPIAANIAMILSVPVYGSLLWLLPNVAFLHHMAITFILLTIFMLCVTLVKPLEKPVVMPTSKVNIEVMPSVYVLGSIIIAMTVVLYVWFW
jgi:SSS family solute:Na+ symporter